MCGNDGIAICVHNYFTILYRYISIFPSFFNDCILVSDLHSTPSNNIICLHWQVSFYAFCTHVCCMKFINMFHEAIHFDITTLHKVVFPPYSKNFCRLNILLLFSFFIIIKENFLSLNTESLFV